MNDGDFQIGQRVRVARGEPPYFSRGDIAVLTRRDDDLDWWGDIEGGEPDVCLTQNGAIEAIPQ